MSGTMNHRGPMTVRRTIKIPSWLYNHWNPWNSCSCIHPWDSLRHGNPHIFQILLIRWYCFWKPFSVLDLHVTLPQTSSSHRPGSRAPKRNNRLPTSNHSFFRSGAMFVSWRGIFVGSAILLYLPMILTYSITVMGLNNLTPSCYTYRMPSYSLSFVLFSQVLHSHGTGPEADARGRMKRWKRPQENDTKDG